MTRARLLSLVASLLGLALVPASTMLSVASLGCDYETDPECEDPDRGHISGTVLLPSATSASSLELPPAMRERLGQVRAAVSRFTREDPEYRFELEQRRRDREARGDELGASALGRLAKARPSWGKNPSSRRSLTVPREERWREGEIILRGETAIRGHRPEWEARLAALVGPELQVRIGLCNTDVMCLLHVTDRDGKALPAAPTRALADRLSDHPALRYATVNRISYALRTPNDDFYPYQWHYSAMNLEAAWDITTGSDNVTVAVIDTGVLVNHPDLSPRVVQGADLISDTSLSNDGDGRDNNPNDPGDNSCGNGCHSYHGSHVAGTIGAATDNASKVAGVSWAGRILPVRVLGQGGSGSNFDIIAGVYWAIGVAVDGVSTNGRPADVINMSLGGPGDDPATDEAVQDATNAGAIVIVAAGNNDTDASTFSPANSPASITIAALGNGAGGTPYRAPYSNYGNVVDVAAPGGDLSADNDGDGFPDGVLSTMADDVDFQQGTSMACPHVAGLAVLMKSIDPGLTQEEARGLLTANADPDINCSQGCGAGAVDAARTLLALEGRANEPLLTVRPSTVRLGRGVTSGELVMRNVGGAATAVNIGVTGPGREKVSVGGGVTDLGPDEERTLTINVERGESEVGEATIRIGWGADQVTEARVVWTDDEVLAPDFVGVFAVQFPEDPNEDIHIERGVPALREQSYAYKLFNLTPGAYIVVGAIDQNDDGELEGLGVFPTLNDPVEVEVEAAVIVTGVDFAVAPSFNEDEVDEGDGTSAVGGACAQHTDCQAGLFCDTTLPGGYCTMDCTYDPCPGDGVCYQFSDGVDVYPLCLDGCATDADCRQGEGYVCDADNTCFYYGG